LLSNDVAENPGPYNKVSDLTMFHWNVRSVRNKIEYLETICLGSSIVCITESHLDDKVSTKDILIPGYLEPFRNNRNYFGGGVPPNTTNPFRDNFHYSLEKATESSSRVLITDDLKNVDLLIETNHRLNEIMYNFNLTHCINEATRFGTLLNPIIYSDECEISFSDVIQIDRNISDHDATSASLRIPRNYKLSINDRYGCIIIKIL
jgi:hypothetical protein